MDNKKKHDKIQRNLEIINIHYHNTIQNHLCLTIYTFPSRETFCSFLLPATNVTDIFLHLFVTLKNSNLEGKLNKSHSSFNQSALSTIYNLFTNKHTFITYVDGIVNHIQPVS